MSTKTAKNCPSVGRFYILATLNNTIVTVTDSSGNVIKRRSSGQYYKGSRKSTPYAAQLAADNAAEYVSSKGMRTAEIIVRGPGPGRESAIRAVFSRIPTITKVTDVTAVPHNGPRARKKRRV